MTAAFIACIYALVAAAAIGTGLLDLGLGLAASVAIVACLLIALAAALAGWQLAARGTPLQ